MKLSLEFDWKEMLALAGAILIGLGAGVVGSSFLRQAQTKTSINIPVKGSVQNLNDYLQKQINPSDGNRY